MQPTNAEFPLLIYTPFIGLEGALNDPQQRALSCPIAAHNSHTIALSDGQRGIRQNGRGAVAEGDGLE